MMQKHDKWLKPWHMVLMWENSARAIQLIPTWQGLNGFQISLRPCALDKSSLSNGRVKTNPYAYIHLGFAPAMEKYWPLSFFVYIHLMAMSYWSWLLPGDVLLTINMSTWCISVLVTSWWWVISEILSCL